jgi:periplasmic protein TonB
MFETTLLESLASQSVHTRRHRLVATVAGTALEIAALVGLILVPLIRTQAIDLKNLQERVPPPRGPRSVKVIAVVHERSGGGAQRPVIGPQIIVPERIPEHVYELQDPPISANSGPGPISGSPNPQDCPGCVIGSPFDEVASYNPPMPPPPSKPKPVERQTVISDVQSAKLVYGPKPEYPIPAKIVHVQGMVRLEAVIGTDGRVQNLQVISGHPMLVKAAMDAVSQWRYQPTLLNGEPVEVETEINVNFVLGN